MPEHKRRRISYTSYAVAENDGLEYCRAQDPTFVNRAARMRVVWENYASAISNQCRLRKERNDLALAAIKSGNESRSLTQQVLACQRVSEETVTRAAAERKNLDERRQSAEDSCARLSGEATSHKEAALESARAHDQTIARINSEISVLRAKVSHYESGAVVETQEYQRLLQEYNRQSDELREKNIFLQQYQEAAQTVEAQKPISQDLSHLFEHHDAVDKAREEGREEGRQDAENDVSQRVARIQEELEKHYQALYNEELSRLQPNSEPAVEPLEQQAITEASAEQLHQQENTEPNASMPPTRVPLAPKSTNTKSAQFLAKRPAGRKLDTTTRPPGVSKSQLKKDQVNGSTTLRAMTAPVAKSAALRKTLEERRQKAQGKLSQEATMSTVESQETVDYMSQDFSCEMDLAEKHYIAEQWDKLPYKDLLHSQDGTRWLLFTYRPGRKPMRSAIAPSQLNIANKQVHILPYPKVEQMSLKAQIGYAKLCLLAQIPECQAEAAKTFLSTDQFQNWLMRSFGSAVVPDAPERDDLPKLWDQAVGMLNKDARFQKACIMWSDGATAKD